MHQTVSVPYKYRIATPHLKLVYRKIKIYKKKKSDNKNCDILELPLNFSNEAFLGAYVSFRGPEFPVAPPYLDP